MNIKDLKERLTETEYVYVAIPSKEVIVEFTDREKAIAYARTFKGIVYDYLPYEVYNYEDPYSFTNDWIVLNTNGDIIEYNITKDNIVTEAVVG